MKRVTAVNRPSTGMVHLRDGEGVGEEILVDFDGQRVTAFDPRSPNLPPQKQWHEPKREPKRPEAGYIGLQNHDPGDVVWFKEVSVRPLLSAVAK